MKLYVVMRIDKFIMVNNEDQKLPDGQFILPVFEDYNVALEYSNNGKYEIIEMETFEVK